MRTVLLLLVVTLLVLAVQGAMAQGTDPNSAPAPSSSASPISGLALSPIAIYALTLHSVAAAQAGATLSGHGWSMKGSGVLPWIVNHTDGELPVVGSTWSSTKAGIGVSLNVFDAQTGALQLKAGPSYISQIPKAVCFILGGTYAFK